MKKKLFLLSLSLFLLCGCGKIPTLSNGEEAVVKFEDGTLISVDDLYSQMKSNYAIQTLLSMTDKNILEKEYKDDLESATKSAEDGLTKIKDYYKDDALNAIQYYTGYSSFDAYKDSLYISYLQNLAATDYAKSLITDKQVKKYYKDEAVGDIKVSHILITPDVTDDMETEDKEAKEKEALATANEVINKLKNGENFEDLAKEYSDDDATKKDGGNLGYINKGTLGDTYTDFDTAAYKLKDGEYTTEAVKTSNGYHIILRVESKEKASIDDLRDSIIATLAKENMASDSTIAVNGMTELRKKYGMEITDSEIQTQYANYIQNQLANAKKNDSQES